MSDMAKVSSQPRVHRIGILLGDFDKLNVTALKFLVLRMNTLQSFFEFEFLPVPPNESFILDLSTRASKRASVDGEKTKLAAPTFLERYQKYLRERIVDYGLKESPPDHFVLVTLARFSDYYYSNVYYSTEATQKIGLAILAFGFWKRSMAPPSLVEFILINILELSVILAFPSLRSIFHLGTKGCLFDFTPTLDEAKFLVLNAFICNHCREMLQSSGFDGLADELVHVLKKDWFGKSTDPETPAGITAKLGYDLFTTKGLKPTLWETALTTVQQEGVTQLLTVVGTIIGAILVAILLLKLGLK